jgi:galactoside O-acetyltransferase
MTDDELAKIFGRVGREPKVSRGVTVFGPPENIRLGDNVRIDHGVAILAGSGFLEIGSHVHISLGCSLLCTGGITIGDFTAIGFGGRILTASDDFSGEFLIGPMYGEGFTNVKKAAVTMERGAVLGVGCTVMPGVTMGKFSAAGANSLVRKDTRPFTVVFGSPAREAKQERSHNCESLANQWDAEWRKRMGY